MPFNPNVDFWRRRPVLVTGATGFLGGWLIRELLRLDAEVIVIRRHPRPRSQFALSDFASRVTIIEGSVEDPRSVAAALEGRKDAAVFHLASLVDVSAALREPAEAIKSSIDGTLAILEWVRRVDRETLVVVASSDKAYGAQPTPYREDRPLAPLHPYEIAKATQDLLGQSYGKLYGLRIGVLRPGNYFGGWDFAFERIIPYTIQQVLNGRRPVLRSDGTHVRDFLYIEEAVSANLLLAERLVIEPALSGEAFNISHEVGINVLELVQSIIDTMGSTLTADVAANAKAEIPEMRLDNTKVRNVLGWSPALGFNEGLARTINWYVTHRVLWDRS